MTVPSKIGVCIMALAFSCGLGMAAGGNPALGQEFRIDSAVFADGESQPRSQSSTIFRGGMAYDYLTKPTETTVFDPGHDRMVLLDPTRRLRAEISTARIKELTDQLQDWASAQSDAFLRFLAQPTLDRSIDKSGRLEFTSAWLTYRVAPFQPTNPEIARRYQEFSDWSSRLNTLLNPGTRPPFARLIVNDAMRKKSQIPREVELVLRPKQGAATQQITIRSEHRFFAQLQEADRSRAAQTDQFLTTFTPVRLDEYQKRVKQ